MDKTVLIVILVTFYPQITFGNIVCAGVMICTDGEFCHKRDERCASCNDFSHNCNSDTAVEGFWERCGNFCMNQAIQTEVNKRRVSGCQQPKSTNNGQYNGSTDHNKTMHIFCRIGHKQATTSYFRCGDFGQWIAEEPHCEAVTCSSIPALENGVVSLKDQGFGAVANFTCNTGHNLYGTPSTKCLQNGTWDMKVFPVCRKVVSCNAIPDLENGMARLEDGVFGMVANFSCNTGYKLYGTTSAKCLQNGTWDIRVFPRCQKDIFCNVIPDLENGVVSFEDRMFGGIANFSCNTGYQLYGTNSAKCLESGTWDIKIFPLCQKDAIYARLIGAAITAGVLGICFVCIIACCFKFGMKKIKTLFQSREPSAVYAKVAEPDCEVQNTDNNNFSPCNGGQKHSSESHNISTDPVPYRKNGWRNNQQNTDRATENLISQTEKLLKAEPVSPKLPIAEIPEWHNINSDINHVIPPEVIIQGSAGLPDVAENSPSNKSGKGTAACTTDTKDGNTICKQGDEYINVNLEDRNTNAGINHVIPPEIIDQGSTGLQDEVTKAVVENCPSNNFGKSTMARTSSTEANKGRNISCELENKCSKFNQERPNTNADINHVIPPQIIHQGSTCVSAEVTNAVTEDSLSNVAATGIFPCSTKTKEETSCKQEDACTKLNVHGKVINGHCGIFNNCNFYDETKRSTVDKTVPPEQFNISCQPIEDTQPPEESDVFAFRSDVKYSHKNEEYCADGEQNTNTAEAITSNKQ